MDIFGFRQKDLVEYRLNVYHALLLRYIYDENKNRIKVDEIFQKLPVLGDDFGLIVIALTSLQERGLIDCTPLLNGDGTYSYEFEIEIKTSCFNKSKIHFSEFWSKYNYPIGKAVAEKSWNKLNEQEREKAIKHVDGYVLQTLGKKDIEDKQNWKPRRLNASTYLNQKRFLDEEVKEKSEYEKLKETAM